MFGKNIFNFVVHMLRIRLDGASMTVPVNLFIGILKNCKFESIYAGDMAGTYKIRFYLFVLCDCL